MRIACPRPALFRPLPCVAALWLASAASAQAQEVGVGVELVLAVDVSRSIDQGEQLIQRRGYAEAFRSPDVQDAILNGGWGRVAITYVEWGGEASQRVLIPWTLIDSAEAAEALAADIETAPSPSVSRTSISAAIDFSAALFEGNGYAGMRRVIDISGDGPNNQGRSVTEARDAALARGIIVNGLPLMTQDGQGTDLYGGWGSIPDLDRYFLDCVIGGPGAFVVPVTGWDQFAAAVRRKLVLELAGWPLPPPDGLTLAQATPLPDCLIGEKLWEDRRRRWD